MWDKILSSTLESLQVQMGERAVSGISKDHGARSAWGGKDEAVSWKVPHLSHPRRQS